MNSISQRAPKQVTIDYQKSKIYKIVNTINNMSYIGSTTQKLNERYEVHRRRARGADGNTTKVYVAMRSLGIGNFEIVLIEDYPCFSKTELQKREYDITNQVPRELLYNSYFDGKPTAEMIVKLTAAGIKASLKRHNDGTFARGYIGHSKDEYRYKFRWHENGKLRTKSFSYQKLRSQQMAYVECDNYRNQIYPLRFIDIAKELPFMSRE